MNRITWDEYFSKIVNVTSERSPCKRLQVGCLFVKDNRIISQGYNGFLPGCPHKSIVINNHEQATLHAEQNALIDCAKRGVSCKGCTVYVTHYPCIICCRLLLAAEVSEIKYLNDYNNNKLVNYFSKQFNVPLIKLNNLKLINDPKKNNYFPYFFLSISLLYLILSKMYYIPTETILLNNITKENYYQFRR